MNATVSRPRGSAGFTLIELMVTLVVLAVVVAALTTVLFTASRSKTSSANNVEASQAGRIAVEMMARDLRSAGYGADLDHAQPPIAYIDSLQVLICENLQPYPDSVSAAIKGSPLAYNPAGTPRPHPLDGTGWQPPQRYLTGAEIVRWTLDLTNDGAVDANDVNAVDGVDAQRTLNPNDFELVREVYGDSTNNTPGNNGGNTQRVALVRKPGGSVPPMFTVYMKGSSTPWDWSNGPVPPAQLPNIQRVTVQVTAPSGRPDWRGHYAESHFHTDVNSLRNVPDFGAVEYAVDGYVFHDQNGNLFRDPGEPGVPGARLVVDNFSTTTAANGYFSFHLPAGSYWLKQVPPPGYVALNHPESLAVSVPPATTRSFADSLVPGGPVTVTVYKDDNGNATRDVGEGSVRNAKLTLNPGNQVVYTDTSGTAAMFASTGAYTVALTPPDSFQVTTPNPVSGTMTNGGSATHSFGILKAAMGTIGGTVFRDVNRNGAKEGSEAGIPGVWVGVSPDGGITVPGWAYTDANGAYSIQVAANDPPRTKAYSIICIPPDGYFPTSSTTISGVWLQANQNLNGRDFGMASFQIISLAANRVLSLASRDLIESDWNGAHTENAVRDVDLILGSDANGADQISVWFNQYDNTPLFNTTPTLPRGYTRSAPSSVLSMSCDTLDSTSPKARPDLVTGTRSTAAGNFFVWFNQNSNNNEGILPTTFSPGQNYRTNDNGDVQALVTLDCAGGLTPDMPDIIVGTKSPTAYQGTLEVWSNNNAVTPTFTREEIYPPSGGMGALTPMGEVTSIVAADIDEDGYKDLVVGTRNGSYSGRVMFFKYTSRTSPHFTYMGQMTLPYDAVTALGVVDVDGDGHRDVVAGTQYADNGGHLVYFQNTSPALFGFQVARTVNANGPVQAITVGDFGGLPRKDIAVGWRASSTSYVGGVKIYFLESTTFPSSGTDPSGGNVANFVAALTANNFNFGAVPLAAPPYLTDLAAGVKVTSTSGALVVFIR